MLTRNDHGASNSGGGASKGGEINIHGIYYALEVERDLHVQDLKFSMSMLYTGKGRNMSITFAPMSSATERPTRILVPRLSLKQVNTPS